MSRRNTEMKVMVDYTKNIIEIQEGQIVDLGHYASPTEIAWDKGSVSFTKTFVDWNLETPKWECGYYERDGKPKSLSLEDKKIRIKAFFERGKWVVSKSILVEINAKLSGALDKAIAKRKQDQAIVDDFVINELPAFKELASQEWRQRQSRLIEVLKQLSILGLQ